MNIISSEDVPDDPVSSQSQSINSVPTLNNVFDGPQTMFSAIVEDVYPKRSLLVLSKGMRSPLLMAQLIATYAKSRDNSLTIILNLKKDEVPSINEQFEVMKLGRYRVHQITTETTDKRRIMFCAGGIYAISKTIFVMDLLQRSISPSIITNLIINEAEIVDSIFTDESWSTTMIRKENKNVKILAITDNIEVLAQNQVFRKAMHAMYLDYCSVWPLSRYEILKDVTEQSDHLTFESHIKLPGPLKKLQKAVMNVIRSCIEEFNRRFKEKNKGDDVINEMDIFNTSLNVVYYRMKAIANKFNLRGQQLLRDIFEFRMLLLNLIYFDAVEFYLKVLSLRNAANFESIWYIGDNQTMHHIDDLLKYSKQRVFKLRRDVTIEEKKPRKKNTTNMEEEGDLFDEGLEKQISGNLEEDEETVKGEETENNFLDVVKNPINYKGKTYRLDLKININFKYRALVEVLNKLANANKDAPPQKDFMGNTQRKVIWIWAQEERKVAKIKDILTSFFGKKDEHKIKLLLRLNILLHELTAEKKETFVREDNVDDFYDNEENVEPDMPKQLRGKANVKNSNEADVEKFVMRKMHEDLVYLKKEYDNKLMMNLFKSDADRIESQQAVDNSNKSVSQSQGMSGQGEEVDGTKLIRLLKPEKKLKRRFYDMDDNDEGDKHLQQQLEKIEEEKEKHDLGILKPTEILEEIQNEGYQVKEDDIILLEDRKNNTVATELMDDINNFELIGSELGDTMLFDNESKDEEDSNLGQQQKRVMKEADRRKFEYTIINPDKVDLNSFYSYDDSGSVFFDPDMLPGYKIMVNCLGSTAERVSFMKKSQPDTLILFEPQLSLVREIMLEKRCAKYKGSKCTIKEVHILMVQNSIESAIYLDNVRRENSSFVSLLNERSSLPVLDDNPDSRIKKIIYHRQVSTRVGRGIGHALNLSNRPIIIVDKREFNSPVPAKLYHDGFWVIPILLEKGDYILSNSLVIERKCVETGDLLNSLRSGRLDKQMKAMCQTYTRPMLLIEFSEGIDFSLESTEVNRLQHKIGWLNDFEPGKSEINKSNVKFGLALLCMKYPKIQILWSKSPEYTSKIFQRLREENPDPDPRLFAKFQDDAEKGSDADPFAKHLGDNQNQNQDTSELKALA